MPGWLCDIVTTEPFYLVLGALLAGLVGYVTTRFQDAQKTKAARHALTALLHGELATMSPPQDPICHDPLHAQRLFLRSLPLLLAPGVLDPKHDADLMSELIFLRYTVDVFNERARLFDEASANGEPQEKIQLLYNTLQGCTDDYRRAHRNLLGSLWKIGPPLQLPDPYKPRTLKVRFDLWRIREQRNAWTKLYAPSQTSTDTADTVEPKSESKPDETKGRADAGLVN